MGLEKIGLNIVQKAASSAKSVVTKPQTLTRFSSSKVNNVLTINFSSKLELCKTKEELLQLVSEYKTARMNGTCLDDLTQVFKAKENEIQQNLNSAAKTFFESKAAANPNHFTKHSISKPQVETFLTNSNGDYDLLYRIVNSKQLPFSENPSALTRILSSANANTLDFLSKYADGAVVLKKLDATGKNVNLSIDDIANIVQFNRNNKSLEDLVSNPQKLTEFLNQSEKMLDVTKNIDSELYYALKNNAISYQNTGFNARLNNNLLDDMESLIHGKNYYPRFSSSTTSISSVLQKTKLGDAIAIDGKMYLNNGKNIEPLAFTEKTYEKLFPPVSRFNMKQGKIGNCYFVSPLESLMNSKKGRCQIYKMFSQDKYGNLTVQTAKNKMPIIVDDFPQNMPHVENSSGLACIELAYGVGSKNQNVSRLSQITEKVTEGRWLDGAKVGLKSLLGDGCDIVEHSFDVSQIMKTLRQNLSKYADDENYLVQMTFSRLNPKYNILQTHAYSLKGYSPLYDTVVLTNPHRAGLELVIPVSELGPVARFDVTSIL